MSTTTTSTRSGSGSRCVCVGGGGLGRWGLHVRVVLPSPLCSGQRSEETRYLSLAPFPPSPPHSPLWVKQACPLPLFSPLSCTAPCPSFLPHSPPPPPCLRSVPVMYTPPPCPHPRQSVLYRSAI